MEDTTPRWLRHHYPEEEMPKTPGMYATGVNGNTNSLLWTGRRFQDALGYFSHPEFFWSEPLPLAPDSQGFLAQLFKNQRHETSLSQ